MNTSNAQITEFVEYVLSFYGTGGIYDFGATEADVRGALEERIRTASADCPFEGDSVDRELVRDIMLKDRELQHNFEVA
jgi:hypothetical protein